jgi:GrpB-like predicted nucleotidyltransferase (UPF0157 family)
MKMKRSSISEESSERATRQEGREQTDGETTDSKLDDSPTTRLFLFFRDYLDHENDIRENLFRISRDITLRSKRTIFLLHRYEEM